MRQFARAPFVVALVCSCLVGLAATADEIGGWVSWWKSSGQANAARLPPVCIGLPNATKCTTETMTSTYTGATGTGTATGTLTRTLARLTIADSDLNAVTATAVSTYTVVTPNSTKTYTSTLTLAKTDFCSTTGTNGGIPCAGTDSKIDVSWLPSLTATYVTTSALTATLASYATTATLTNYQTTAAMTGYQITAAMTNYMAATVTHLSGDLPTSSATNFANATHTHTVTDVSGAATTATLTNYLPLSEVTATSTSTTGDVTTGHHGFVPKAPNDATKYLNGAGSWAVPSSGGSVSWTNAYEVDFSTLTSQNFLATGDGRKTLSDGSYVNIKNSTVVSPAVISTWGIVNGSGLVLAGHTGGGLSALSGPLTWWRLEETGIDTFTRHTWSEIRVSFIITYSVSGTPTGGWIDAGGYIGNGSGSISSGTNTFSIATSACARAVTETDMIAAKENYFLAGDVGSNNVARGSDTGTAISGSAKDLFVWRTNGSRMFVYNGASSAGSFPTSFDAALGYVGASTITTQNASDAIGPYVLMACSSAATGSVTMTIKKMRIEYR